MRRAVGFTSGALRPRSLPVAIPVHGSATGFSESFRRSSSAFACALLTHTFFRRISISLLMVSTLCDIALSFTFTFHYGILLPNVAFQFLGTYIVTHAKSLLSPLKGNRHGTFQRMGMYTVRRQGHPRAGYTGRIQPTGCRKHPQLISGPLMKASTVPRYRLNRIRD